MKQRYLRPGDELADDITVIVRGGPLDRDLLRSDAQRNFRIYGTYGISVFALRDIGLDELAQRAPLVRFAELTTMTVGALREAGLRLVPSGRNQQHFDVESRYWRLGWKHSSAVRTEPSSTRTIRHRRSAMNTIDLVADLNAEDDDGLGWSTLADAASASRIVPGAYVLAGNAAAQAVVRIVQVDEDGQVHFVVLPGSIAKNRHLLRSSVA